MWAYLEVNVVVLRWSFHDASDALNRHSHGIAGHHGGVGWDVRPAGARTGATSTSNDQTANTSGSHSLVHVFVVDEEGTPVTGQDVAAHVSDAQGRDTAHHQYSDLNGHVEFVREHAAEPLRVTFFVRGQSCGPHTIETGAEYTVEISE